MIYRVYSDLRSFKELPFKPGLNVLLSDKTPEATDRQTRNAAGKTSLVEIIHFLLGGDCGKESIFRSKQLINNIFGMEFDLGSRKVIVERSGKKPSDIFILTGYSTYWPIPPTYDRRNKIHKLSNNQWKTNLGHLVFDLNDDIGKYSPSFRALLPYFIRRQNEGGFMEPKKFHNQQQTWNVQVGISYLLGLDWTISQAWQIVREKERTLKELKKAAEEGAFGSLIGSSSELRTKLAVIEDRTSRMRSDINNFQVLPEYRDLEKEASAITRQLGKLTNNNVIDREQILNLQQALEIEKAPSVFNIEMVYKEVGIVLPHNVIRRFDDVRLFHETVINNRKNYLQSEINDATFRINERDQEMAELSSRRVEIMQILKSHGALDQFNRLQSELTRVEAETEALRQQFIAAQQLEGKKTELDIDRAKLQARLQQNFLEQSQTLNKAIVFFQQISNALYENAGMLEVQESNNGPQFEIKIQGERSKGVTNMQIYCFDMMLMRLCSNDKGGPGFLVHDSHLFDGVDERQVATSLAVGAHEANTYGFQYIITMNSNDVPGSFAKGFNFEDYVLPVKLTDATEDGGLFGMRF